VGVGTLYRNFPSREALVEEVYRSELTRLCATATQLVADYPPADAMREWMRRYQDFVATKHGMAEALRAVIATVRSTPARPRTPQRAPSPHPRRRPGQRSLRTDVPPADVSASMAGIMLTAADIDQATRMLQLLVDGYSPAALLNDPAPWPTLLIRQYFAVWQPADSRQIDRATISSGRRDRCRSVSSELSRTAKGET